MDKYLLILLGGGVGSVLRYSLGVAVTQQISSRFPLGTFLINVSGSFLIGLLMGWFTYRPTVPVHWRLLLVTGFLGGFTTFSSFEWETYLATKSGFGWIGFVYAASSVIFGYGAVWLGAFLAGER